MEKYYEIILTNKKRNRKVTYFADTFSVDEYRILRIKSKEYEDVTVPIKSNEVLIVNEVELEEY